MPTIASFSAGPGGQSALDLVRLTAAWLGMMALMMAPAVWPWMQTFARLSRRNQSRGAGALATLSFASGYLTAWAAYSLAAAIVQIALIRAGAFDPVRGLAPLLAAGVLVAAGLFQFAPLKRACLTHCRNPFTYFLARWRHGPGGGFRLGLGHGLFCVGCCWALMATALAVGVMSLWWMAALAGAVFAEQVLPRAERVRALLGVALVVAGLLRA